MTHFFREFPMEEETPQGSEIFKNFSMLEGFHPNMDTEELSVDELFQLTPEQIQQLPFEQKASISKRIGQAAKQEVDIAFARGMIPGVERLEKEVRGTKEIPETEFAPKAGQEIMEFIGSAIPIHFAGQMIAKPLAKLIPGWKPLSRMLGWGAAGATYEGVKKLANKGEIPSLGEFGKNFASWAAMEGGLEAIKALKPFAKWIKNKALFRDISRKEVLEGVLESKSLNKSKILEGDKGELQKLSKLISKDEQIISQGQKLKNRIVSSNNQIERLKAERAKIPEGKMSRKDIILQNQIVNEERKLKELKDTLDKVQKKEVLDLKVGKRFKAPEKPSIEARKPLERRIEVKKPAKYIKTPIQIVAEPRLKQINALSKQYSKTPTPSIAERLAKETGIPKEDISNAHNKGKEFAQDLKENIKNPDAKTYTRKEFEEKINQLENKVRDKKGFTGRQKKIAKGLIVGAINTAFKELFGVSIPRGVISATGFGVAGYGSVYTIYRQAKKATMLAKKKIVSQRIREKMKRK